MSTRDIEKTLRTQAQMYRQMGNPAQGDILDRAADEIKTLRASHNELITAHTALLINHNALVEAVKLMFIADGDGAVSWEVYLEARAEVDRLVGGEQ